MHLSKVSASSAEVIKVINMVVWCGVDVCVASVGVVVTVQLCIAAERLSFTSFFGYRRVAARWSTFLLPLGRRYDAAIDPFCAFFHLYVFTLAAFFLRHNSVSAVLHSWPFLNLVAPLPAGVAHEVAVAALLWAYACDDLSQPRLPTVQNDCSCFTFVFYQISPCPLVVVTFCSMNFEIQKPPSRCCAGT